MKSLFALLLLVSPSFLSAANFSGRWGACLVSQGGHGLGRCTVRLSIEQTGSSIHVSDRVYHCQGKNLSFQAFTADLGAPLVTPDGSTIKELRPDPYHEKNIVWSECFDLNPGEPECIEGSLSPAP